MAVSFSVVKPFFGTWQTWQPFLLGNSLSRLDPCAEKEVQNPQSSIELQVPSSGPPNNRFFYSKNGQNMVMTYHLSYFFSIEHDDSGVFFE